MASNTMGRPISLGFNFFLLGLLLLVSCQGKDDSFIDFDATGDIAAFQLKATEVCNAEYQEFVLATGHLTCAELGLADLPPGSFRFMADSGRICFVPGLSWKEPEEAGIRPEDWERLPVVHLCRSDIMAYLKWKGERLPTHDEFKLAMTLGRTSAEQTRPHGNTWQGLFPWRDLGEDGFAMRLAPVAQYKPIEGLFDLIGNAWEVLDETCITGYVAAGGSYLCSPGWCRGYLAESPLCIDPTLPYGHVGFRTAKKNSP